MFVSFLRRLSPSNTWYLPETAFLALELQKRVSSLSKLVRPKRYRSWRFRFSPAMFQYHRNVLHMTIVEIASTGQGLSEYGLKLSEALDLRS